MVSANARNRLNALRATSRPSRDFHCRTPLWVIVCGLRSRYIPTGASWISISISPLLSFTGTRCQAYPSVATQTPNRMPRWSIFCLAIVDLPATRNYTKRTYHPYCNRYIVEIADVSGTYLGGVTHGSGTTGAPEQYR